MTKQKKRSSGAGNWGGFIRMIGRIDLPWLMIIVTFAVNMLYNEVLLRLPGNTASLMSGNLDGQALIDVIIYYVSYALTIIATTSVGGITNAQAVRNARRRLWDGMMRVRTDYYDGHTPSALTSAVTNDLDSAVGTLVGVMVGVLPSIYYVIRALRKIGGYDVFLAASVLVALPLQYVYSLIVGRWNYRTQSNIYRRIGDLTGYLAERVKNLPLIKHFGMEPEELDNGTAAAENLLDANMKAVKLRCGADAAASAINLVSQITILFTGVILLQKGRINISQWVMFFLFSNTILQNFTELLGTWENLKSAQGQVARVVELMEAPKEEIRDDGALSAALNASPAVAFQNVSFSYGEKQALKDVSFSVPAGSATAIVGLTGSGKTTALNLLERFYETGAGSVTLDGQDVREMDLAELRSHYSYVQQNAGVFSGTVREALTYGLRREVSDEEIIAAAKSAGAWDFVEKMPDKLDAVIAADGSSLSGGQRQRLVLAREFLRGTGVLLLDEPTSALDAQTARAVEETILRMFRGKTILMITHDMSLVSNMDQIIVLSLGQVVGAGTYQQLLTDCPLFRDMIRAQLGKEVV